MENLFENAKFGDKFLRRDGHIAIFSRFCVTTGNVIYFDDQEKRYIVLPNGKKHNWTETEVDIISRYQEPIDEDKLDELAESMSNGFWSDDLESFEDNPQRDLIIWVAERIYKYGIKNGYKKALGLLKERAEQRALGYNNSDVDKQDYYLGYCDGAVDQKKIDIDKAVKKQ